MNYTTEYIKKYFNLNKATLKRLREYLEIKPVKNGKFLEISQEDFDRLDTFLKENPNTKVFFQKQTFLKKYGVENPQQLKSIKEKTSRTVMKKYGVENISQSKEIKEKKKNTVLKNYGVENPSQNKDILNKVFETKLLKYGDKTYGSFSSDVHKKIILEKYGTDNPMKNKSISAKSRNRRLENKKQILEQFTNLFSVAELCVMFERCYDTMLDILRNKDISIIEIEDSYYVNKSEFYKIEEYISCANSKRTSMAKKNY